MLSSHEFQCTKQEPQVAVSSERLHEPYLHSTSLGQGLEVVDLIFDGRDAVLHRLDAIF